MTRIEDGLPPELARRLGFETLIAELSSKFVNLPSWKIDGEIENSQRLVCEFLGIELSALWQWSRDDPDRLIQTHLYRPLGGPDIPEPLEASSSYPWVLKQMMSGQTVVLSSVKDAPPEAARDMEVWKHFGVKAGIAIPLLVGKGDVLGVISFNTMTEERSWPDDIVKRLQLVAELFTNAISRKRSDERIRESEERLSLAADSAGAGLWSLNLSTGIFWLTDLTRTMFGFSLDETVTLERFIGCVHPDDRKKMGSRVRQIMEDPGESMIDENGIEYRVVSDDGSIRWLISKGRVYHSVSGGTSYLMGVSIDITDRKRVDEAARGFSGRLINAHEEERARLARELHDDLTQRLARMAIDTAQIERRVSGPALQKSLRELQENLVKMSEDVHTLSYRLHPSMLEDLGLVDAIETECERVSRLESREITFEIEEPACDLPREVALCLYRITQEALRNAVRHAGECGISVTLRCMGDSVVLSISDDGAGFDTDHAMRGCTLGLTGMHERVQLVEGSIKIDSMQGRGTTVSVSIPRKQE